MRFFTLLAGISTMRCLAIWALRMRVRKSAIGSVTILVVGDFRMWIEDRCPSIDCFVSGFSRELPTPESADLLTWEPDYQLAFLTPGILPSSAISRNITRAMPNWRIY